MMGQFNILIPEIALAIIAMFMQLVSVYNPQRSYKLSSITIILVAILATYMLYAPVEYEYYQNSFLASSVINLFKVMVLGLAVMCLLIYRDFIKISGKEFKSEFPTLILLSSLGILFSISARDFLLLFCGLELQALSGYALTAFNTKDEKSSEAGLKYFILGALISGIMLMGISFIYGFTGSINFLEIKHLTSASPSLGVMVGLVFVLVAILFKMSAAPLHIWTPDVYEGAPITAVSYFATAQKFGMLLVLINVVDGVVGNYYSISEDILKICAILSMLVGSFGAIGQNSLKRLMAYSSIVNMGYVLMAVRLSNMGGNNVAYVYMLIYVMGTIGLFASLVALLGERSEHAVFDDLRGASVNRKALSSVIAIIMFSMIGLPPFAGFFGKYYVFSSAIQQGEFVMTAVGLVASVVSAFYYLKVVKYMYFIKPGSTMTCISTKRGLWLVTTISITFTIFFFLFAHKYIV